MFEGYASGMMTSPQVMAEQWIKNLNDYIKINELPEVTEYNVSDSGVIVRWDGHWALFPLTELGRWTPEAAISQLRQQ